MGAVPLFYPPPLRLPSLCVSARNIWRGASCLSLVTFAGWIGRARGALRLGLASPTPCPSRKQEGSITARCHHAAGRQCLTPCASFPRFYRRDVGCEFGGDADCGGACVAGEAAPLQQFIGVERDRPLAARAWDGLARHRRSPLSLYRSVNRAALREERGPVMDNCDTARI